MNYPPISANTLFHFTNSLDNLTNILSNEFHPRFCLENFELLFTKEHEPIELEFAIPMVCFCDLPLSQTGNHLETYGDYGLGMTKGWAIKNGINPVLYAYKQSLLTDKLERLFDLSNSATTGSELDREVKMTIHRIISYLKPYEGNFWRPNGIREGVRFYNEREWRFVPTLLDVNSPFWGLLKTDFLKEEIRTQANSELAEISTISFGPSDIKYIIVKNEEEIVPLIQKLEVIKEKYSLYDVKLLTSRMISTDQIRSDF